MNPGPPAPSFTVLVVCTGNICRSPAVERLLTAELGPGSGVTVTSAGTRAMVGDPVSPPMVPLIAASGAVADGFVARQLTEAMVRDGDLVLALTREHRSRIVELFPAAVRRTFTLRELSRLAATVDPGALPEGPPATRLAALVTLAAAQRGRHPAVAEEDDVEDPYGRGDRVYANVFAQIQGALEPISRLARG